MKLLVLAEACNPEWTSVPLVGYNLARALAERPDLDVTLVSHVRNKPAIERSPVAELARLEFINNEWLAKPLYTAGKLLRGGGSLGWTTNMAVNWPAYVCFERLIYQRFRKELKSGEFDLIHRITPVSPTMPSPLATMSEVPMLIGPLNGGLPWPELYPELRKKEREWLVPLRSAYKLLPYYRSSYRKLAGVIGGSQHTASETPESFRGHHFYLPENGIDPERFEVADAWTPPAGRFRFVAVGRLVPYKGFHLTLEAMAGSEVLRESELLIIGEGPERERLERMAAENQLNVRFAGWLSQNELARQSRESQAFVFPSLREFGGGVVLEAMASGLPSIVVDYGGPGELVTPETGIALPMQPAEPLVQTLREAMERLVMDHGLCRELSNASIHRIRNDFTWAAKADRITGFYRETLGLEQDLAQSQDNAPNEEQDSVAVLAGC